MIQYTFAEEANSIFVEGKMIEMDTVTKIINNRAYLPLWFVSETFGLNVFLNMLIIYNCFLATYKPVALPVHRRISGSIV